MASGTRSDSDAGRRTIGATADKMMGRVKRLGMSPRQQLLNRLWQAYRCESYNSRRLDWDGREVVDPVEHEAIATAGFIPPGFYDAGGQMNALPLKFRKPTAPYNLNKVIVDRFTGLLFSERRHPQLRVEGDPQTEEVARAFAEVSRLWPAMIQARAFGGATGTVAVGFQFVDSKPVIEVHDPRWLRPEFIDRVTMELRRVEKRFMFPDEAQNEETGEWEQVWFWYRRVIDQNTDTLWKPIPVGEGEEPDWEDPDLVEDYVEHNFGECPVQWIQNLPVVDDIDGDPDCHGVYDMIETIDALISQANRGTLFNCLGVETPFITSAGVRRFSDFRDGDRTVVLTHAGRWKNATVRCFGRQKLFAVRLGRGGNSQTVRATRDHAWMLQNGLVTTDLSVGNKLYKPPHLVRDWAYEESPGEQQRYWAWGFAYGDGSVDRRGDGSPRCTRVRLCGPKVRFLGRFEALGYEATYPKSCDGEPLVWLRDYFKTLPDLAVQGHENVMAFVRGYLDADGSRNLKHPEMSDVNPFQGIQATGKEAVEFIRSTFPAVGAYIVNEDERTGDSTNFGERTDETVYFSLVLGFANSPVSPYIVREIAEAGVEDVWCLEVEGDHSFVLPSGVVTRNCDPTLFISSPDPLPEIVKGSGSAIKVTSGDGKFMEMNGAGVKAARELAEELRHKVLEVSQCVLEHPDVANRTATEVTRTYSSMHAKADVLREQYGERCVKPLMEKMIRAAKKVTQTVQGEDGSMVRGALKLPSKVEKTDSGDVQMVEHKLGPGGLLKLQWPEYEDPILTDVQLAVRAAADAKATGLIDAEHAAKFVSDLFRVEDVKGMMQKAAAEAQQAQNQLAQDALDNLNAAGPGVPAAPAAIPGGQLGSRPFGAAAGAKR